MMEKSLLRECSYYVCIEGVNIGGSKGLKRFFSRPSYFIYNPQWLLKMYIVCVYFILQQREAFEDRK